MIQAIPSLRENEKQVTNLLKKVMRNTIETAIISMTFA